MATTTKQPQPDKEVTTNVADDLKTEQEKTPSPAGAKHEVGTATPVEIKSTEPYPEGTPPDPEDAFFAAHGFRRAST